MIEHLGTAQGIVTASVVLGAIIFAVAVHRHQQKQLKERDAADERRVTPIFEEGAMRSNTKRASTSEQRFADAREERMKREALKRQQAFQVRDDVVKAKNTAISERPRSGSGNANRTDDSMSLAHPLHPLNPVSPVYDSTPSRPSDSSCNSSSGGWGESSGGSSSYSSSDSSSCSPSSD